MKAETAELKKILQGDQCFLIPDYQRPYVWNAESQWEPLWDDIQETARRLGQLRVNGERNGDEIARIDENAPPHFLGAIVVEQQATGVGSLNQRAVVDGQQRLTTIQLLLRGVLDALDAVGIRGRSAKLLRKLTRNDDDIYEGDDQFKVVPRTPDREAFFDAMAAESKLETRFSEARKYFAAATREFLGDPEVPLDPFAEGDDAARRASLLVASLQSLLKLVIINLEGVDDAQVIFEALNARGTPLSAADLVKNLLFMRAKRENGATHDLYAKYWARFDENEGWWRKQMGTGHTARARQDWLISDWLIANTGEAISVSRMYSEFRRWLEREKAPVVDVLESFSKYADAYERIQSGDGVTSRERAAFRRLEVTNVTAVNPVLLWLLVQDEETLRAEERERAILALESYVIRRVAARFQTRGYGRFFAEIVSSARSAETSPGIAVIDALKERSDSALAWPSADVIKESFLTGRYYGPGGVNRRRLAMIFGAIDARLLEESTKTERLTIDYSGLTIEHILPQAWSNTWPLSGEDEATRLKAKTAREARINRIGNLTLVNDRLNPALSNAEWKVKREELRKSSRLQLNVLLCANDVWDEAKIDARGEWLAGEFEKVWPGPGAAFWAGRREES